MIPGSRGKVNCAQENRTEIKNSQYTDNNARCRKTYSPDKVKMARESATPKYAAVTPKKAARAISQGSLLVRSRAVKGGRTKKAMPSGHRLLETSRQMQLKFEP